MQKGAVMPDNLYDTDFVCWAEHNAELLRSGAIAEADLVNIAEEIEDLGKSWHRALDSHLMQLLAHLLKLRYQPDYPGARSWGATVATRRIDIEKLLAKAPSLRPELADILPETYRDAVYLAITETGLPAKSFPAACPWTVDQILDRNLQP